MQNSTFETGLKWDKIVIDQIFACLHLLCNLPSEWLVDFMSIYQVGILFATITVKIYVFSVKLHKTQRLLCIFQVTMIIMYTGINRKLETAFLDCINISRALPDVNSYNRSYSHCFQNRDIHLIRQKLKNLK